MTLLYVILNAANACKVHGTFCLDPEAIHSRLRRQP